MTGNFTPESEQLFASAEGAGRGARTISEFQAAAVAYTAIEAGELESRGQ